MKTQAEEFITEILLETFPDGDITENSPLYDVFVRFPAQYYLPDILKLEENIQPRRSLTQLSMDESSYDELLANWRFNRNPGTYTKLQARIVFKDTTPRKVLTTDVYKINGQVFHPVVTHDYLSSEFKALLVTDSATKYFIDISLISEEVGIGDKISVNGTSVTTPYNADTSFIASEVLGISQGGSVRESNESALVRLQNELGVRDYVSFRSLSAFLSDRFPGEVNDLYTAGFKEPEQQRDKIQIELPRRMIRLMFSEKVHLTIRIDEFFLYNGFQDIKYRVKEAVDIPINSPLWKTDAEFPYVNVEVILYSRQNYLGFNEDISVTNASIQSRYPQEFISMIAKTVVNSSATVRVGGKTDVYIRPNIVRDIIPVTVPLDYDFTQVINLPKIYTPFFKIHHVYVSRDISLAEIAIHTIDITNPELRFSADDTATISVDGGPAAGETVYLDISYSPSIQDINTVLQESDNRLTLANTLVRSYSPVFVDLNILSPNLTESKKDSVKNALGQYIQTIRPGGRLSRTKVIEAVGSVLGIILSRVMNITCTQIIPLSGDLGEVLLNPSGANGEVWIPQEFPALGITQRTTMFVLGDITFIETTEG